MEKFKNMGGTSILVLLLLTLYIFITGGLSHGNYHEKILMEVTKEEYIEHLGHTKVSTVQMKEKYIENLEVDGKYIDELNYSDLVRISELYTEQDNEIIDKNMIIVFIITLSSMLTYVLSIYISDAYLSKETLEKCRLVEELGEKI